MARHGKVKARQVNSIKDGFKSAEKQQQHPGNLNKSIQDGKINIPKPQPGQGHARKASVGVISPSQGSQSLLGNKLVFSGSQLAAFQVEKVASGKPPTVKEKLNVT